MERTDSFTTWLRVMISAALVITLGTALSFAGPTPVAQAALDILPSTSFELDGDLAGDQPGIGFDWEDPYGIGTTPDGYPTTGLYYVNENEDLCASTQDDIGASGPQVKLGDGPIWRHTFAEANPAQTDLAAVWVAAEKVKAPNPTVGAQIFDVLYLGYELCQTSNGAFNGAVYFDGGDGVLPYDPADQPTGSTDDQLIVFDFDPNDEPTATLYNFDGNNWVLDQTAVVPGSFEADAASDRIIGEAAINLTTFAGGILPPDECKTITVRGQASTVAGGSLTSAVKDLVDVDPLQISNCGGLDVTKRSSPADVEDGTYFPYLVGQLDANGGGIVHDDTLTVSGVDAGKTTEPNAATNEIDAQIQVNETHEWRNVISQPDYTLVEGVPVPDSGWTLESIECTYFDIFSGQEEVAVIHPAQDPIETFLVPPSVYGTATLAPAACEIVNATSAITVVKTGAGDPTTQFTFDATGQSSFPLTIADDAGTPDVDESRKTFTVTPGTEVTISESIPATSPTWSLDAIDCVRDSDGVSVLSESDPQDGEIIVTALEGDGVTCTFTNNQAGRIIVEKIGAPDGGSFDFEADIDGNVDVTPDFSLAIPSTTGAGAYDSGDIPAGDYTITELLAGVNAGDGPAINGSVNCTDETPVGPTTGDVVATVDLAAGEVVTCTFSNDQLGRIIVEKATTNGDGTFDFDLPGDAGDGSITTVDGTGTSTLSVDVMPGPHDVTETIPAGWDLASATCSDGSGTPAIGEDSGSITGIDVGAGEIVTCTFTNTRETAQLVLTKDWSVTAEAGDSVTLTATGDDSETAGPANGGSTAPAADTDAVLVVYPGETVGLEEAYAVGNAANYSATLSCDNGDAGTLTYTAGDLSGSFVVVDDDPQNVTCTFVNSRDAANLTLEKVWVDGFEGDLDRALPADTAVIDADGSQNTSTVGEATPASVTVPVLSGATVDLSENLDGNTGSYTTELTCTDADGLEYTAGALEGSYTMPAEAADVTCTFTNTRTSTDLTLTKTWSNAAANDSVDLAIDGEAGTGEGANSGDGTTTDDATLTVYSGEVVDLSEVFDPGDADWYDTGLTCSAGDLTYTDDELTAELEVTSTTDPITCTFTNDRRTANIVVAKDVAPDTDGGVFDLSINGNVELADAGDGDATDPVSVFVGDPVTVAEANGTETDLVNYTSTLACDNGVVPNPNSGVSGGFDVPDTLADGATITCTFTNTRKSAELTLTKDWVNGATGDAVSLTASGDSGNSLSALGSSTAPDTDSDAVLTVWAGEDVTVTEAYAGINVGSYTADLSCTDAGGLVYTDLALTGTYAVPSTPVDVTCTFVNTRTSAELTLQKAWVDGAGGDTADLDITARLGQDPADGNTSTSGGVIGTETDDTDVVTATVLSGETVDLDEVLGAGNTGAYDSTLACGQDEATVGTSGTYTMPKDPEPVTCTFTNTRTRVDLVVDKEWVDAVDGDTTEITVTGDLGAPSSTSTATGVAGTETDAAVVTATVLSGEAVDIAEVLGVDNDAVYTSALDCGDGVIGTTSGQVTVAKGATDDITCTFTNTARRGTIIIVKNIDGVVDSEFGFTGDWTDGVTDTTDFTIETGVAEPLTGMITFNGVLVPADGSPYSVEETITGTNYDATSVTCVDTDGGSGPDGSTTLPLVGSIELDDGETVTCTFTNTEKAKIIVVKDAQPDSAAEFDFESTFGDDFTLVDDGSGTANEEESALLDARADETYTVTELATPGWTLDSAGCTGADSFELNGSDLTVDVTPGVTATCTFVNTANPAGLTATKAVDGVEGAWGPFTFTLSGGTFTGDAAQDVDSADAVAQWTNLVEGETYTIVESEVPGYETGAEFACALVDPNEPNDPVALVDGSADAGFQFTAIAGGVYSCDITNVAIPADVSVAKTVAGVADTQDWAFDFSITAVSAGAAEPVLDSADTTAEGTGSSTSTDTVDWSGLTPGATYLVAESIPNDGYLAGALVCTGVTDLDEFDQTVTFVAPLGGDGVEISCDITNTAIPSQASVTKTVDGGLADGQVWEFDFTIAPAADPSGTQTATNTGDGDDTVTWTGLVPGETYEISEVLPGANTTTYDNGVLSCSIGTNVDDQTVSFVAPLDGEGVDVTCSVTNTAQSDVSYDKVLTGDPVRNADGTWSLSYTLTVENAADAGAGTYDLSDTFLFGEGVSIVADSAAVANTAPGTITTNAAFDGDTDPDIVTGEAIAAGATHTYVVTVDVTIAVGPDTDGDCVREDEGGTGFLNEMSIAVDGGEPETTDACAGFATLTLVKVVSNDDGGNATVTDFPLTAEGPVTLTGISGTDAVSSAVPAGSYTLSEDQLVEGYLPSLFLCDGGSGTVTLADGDNVTCTIVNDDEPVDLAITKNDDGVTAIAGGAPFDYTITVQNVGTRDADLGEAVTVVDELPLPLQWVSFPDDCEQAGQTLTCDIDPALMTAGGDPVVITATVSAPADAASGTYVNEASVTTEDDPVCEPIGDCEPPPCEAAASNNNIDCEPTPVDRQGAIRIVKTDDVANGDSVLPGESFEYTLEVTNIGVSTILPGLVVTDDLPAQLSLVSVGGGAGWTCNDADPIECTYAPSLAPGASTPDITVVVSVNADATGTAIDNTAVVQGAVDRECPEPSAGADLSEAFVPACNQVTDDDDETTPLTAQADLAIDKTASVATVGAGSGFEWVLVVENLGPAPAIDVVVGDLVPGAVTVTGVTSSFFDCSRSGNDVTCTRPQMAVGASGTITIAVSVPADAEGGTVDNVGNVQASTPDPNLDNNSDDASVVVVAQIPPTSVVPTPTIPATGSNATEPVVKTALVLLMLGALGLVAARRRRPDEATPTV